MKRVLIIMSILILNMTYAQNSGKFYIQKRSGDKISYSIDNVKKITFPLNELRIEEIDGTSSNYTLNALDKIIFGSVSVDNIVSSDGNVFEYLKIYPNPVRESLVILFNSNDSRKVKIEILDIMGKIIDNRFVNTEMGENQISVTAHSLPEGIYFCRISYAQNIQIVKFIKVNN